jgi:tripartite ATP-independent transporter DctP family solute receptor
MNRAAFAGGTIAALGAAPLVRAVARAPAFAYRFAHNLPQTHPLHLRAVELWQAVREQSGGRLVVTVFPNNALGDDLSMLARLRAGSLQFFTASGGLLGRIVPAAQIENIGFAFESAGAAFSAMDGALGAYVRDACAQRGLVALDTIWDNGMRQITSETHPIRSVDDLAGFRIRTPPGALWLDLFRSLGARPVPIAGDALYAALRDRRVDGEENALAAIDATRLYAVQRYLTMSNHLWAGYWMTANADAWAALPQDLRAIVVENNRIFATKERHDVAQRNATLAATLEHLGMQIDHIEPQPFRARLGPYYARWKARLGDRAWQLLELTSGPLG